MRKLIKILTIIIAVSVPFLLFAPPGGSWNPGNTDPTVPLNGGLIYLIIAGIIYGFRRYITKRK